MHSRFLTITNTSVALALSVLIWSYVARAQDQSAAEQKPDSDEVLLSKAEEDIRKSRWEIEFAIRADRRLKELLMRYPDSALRYQAEEYLHTLSERLGAHNLNIALFYLKRFEQGKAKSISLKGAESRLLHVICEYPKFSRMDEVLLHLTRLYEHKDDAEEASRYLQQFILKRHDDRNFKEACEELRRL